LHLRGYQAGSLQAILLISRLYPAPLASGTVTGSLVRERGRSSRMPECAHQHL
jgi:hypothetical protein